MGKPAVVYTLIAIAFFLFLASSRTPHSAPRSHPGRRLAHSSRLVFDFHDEHGTKRRQSSGLLDHDRSNEIGDIFDEDGPMNVTEWIMYLFPLLDQTPKDGAISFEELEAWKHRQAWSRLVHSTKRRMKLHDKDEDGSVTLLEFLSYPSDREIDWNNMEHGVAGWWKEQFVNADKDGNGSLNDTELIDFLHPEDSRNPKIQMWLQKEKLREMDADNDGKLSFSEFRDQSYDIFKNYPAFDSEDNNPQHHAAKVEKKFTELDVNDDKFLTAEELKPIIHQLNPGEFSYATYFTKYLIHEADDSKDGKLTLKEMLDHHHAFYSTVVDDHDDDDDDYDYDIHDELR